MITGALQSVGNDETQAVSRHVPHLFRHACQGVLVGLHHSTVKLRCRNHSGSVPTTGGPA